MLNVQYTGKPRVFPDSVFVRSDKDQPSFVCTVEYTGPAPNITWTHVNKGVETAIACRNPSYKIVENVSQREDGRLILRSTLTFLDLNGTGNFSIAVVRCSSGNDARSEAYLLKIIGRLLSSNKKLTTNQ